MEDCPFCKCADREINRPLVRADGTPVAGQLAFVRHDLYPLATGHVEVVPYRHVETPWQLTRAERVEIDDLLHQAHDVLENRYHPDGWNAGYNVGKAGGQTVPHVHLHLWPRYVGDVPDPAGGITLAGPPRAMPWILEGGG